MLVFLPLVQMCLDNRKFQNHGIKLCEPLRLCAFAVKAHATKSHQQQKKPDHSARLFQLKKTFDQEPIKNSSFV